MSGILSVNDQSVTGVVTRSPLSQSPGTLHDRDLSVGGQSLGSKPVKLSISRSAAKPIIIDPTIFAAFFILAPNYEELKSTTVPSAEKGNVTSLPSLHWHTKSYWDNRASS